ncbi:MAG: hypothetical protein IMZ69_10200, partial [Spirochaetes bacterium]|nr:hypothetical protein [Spirochaetota bacterium]
EYRDLSDTWRNLDTKAQGLGAIAGIFLAAVFAWTRDLPSNFGRWERLQIVANILFLLSAIIATVLALLVRRVTAPPFGDETAEMVTEILAKQKPEELQQRLDGFFGDQMKAWKDTNKELLQHSQSKALRLVVGQVTLVVAAVLVAALAMVAIVRPQ